MLGNKVRINANHVLTPVLVSTLEENQQFYYTMTVSKKALGKAYSDVYEETEFSYSHQYNGTVYNTTDACWLVNEM